MDPSAANVPDEPSPQRALSDRVDTIRARAIGALRRAEAAHADLAALRDEVERRLARVTWTRASASDDAVHQSRPLQGPPATSAVAMALDVLGLAPEDLGDFTDDLCAAYRRAVQDGDDLQARLYERALHIIGRHYADRTGPKAAGIARN